MESLVDVAVSKTGRPAEDLVRSRRASNFDYDKFTRDLAHVLPGRPLRQVREILRETYEPAAGGGYLRWSLEDDATLLQRRKEGFSWPSIGSELNRTRLSCHRRWRRLACPPLPGPWSAVEDERLRVAHKDLGSRWIEVSVLVGNRNPSQCKSRWCVQIIS